jgi:hypothetical protein
MDTDKYLQFLKQRFEASPRMPNFCNVQVWDLDQHHLFRYQPGYKYFLLKITPLAEDPHLDIAVLKIVNGKSMVKIDDNVLTPAVFSYPDLATLEGSINQSYAAYYYAAYIENISPPLPKHDYLFAPYVNQRQITAGSKVEAQRWVDLPLNQNSLISSEPIIGQLGLKDIPLYIIVHKID